MGGFFESAYEGVPPWDIGRPQKEFVRLAEAGVIRGSVLDIGCGTGENALYFAALGHEVWGVDAAPTAIRKARGKAKDRRVEATFVVHDALQLQRLGRTFDTVIDSGLFHTFSDEDRNAFTTSLGAVLPRGGRYLMMCFSEHEPGDWGPRRVTQAEIRKTFRAGWRVESIRRARFEANVDDGGAAAWLSTIARR
jgi:cyclopropane fatty-acyl-phospholipid synthase-like methyltransferase